MRSLKEIPTDTIRSLAEQGLTTGQMAQLLDCNAKSIQNRMRREGIPGRPRGMQRGFRQHRIRIDEPKMIELYQSGLSCREVAEALKVRGSKPTEIVRERLEVLGVPRRVGKAAGKSNPQWKGGRNDDVRNSHRYECYKVVVAFLGSLLPTGWVIHHLDENPANNDLPNLALFPSSSLHCSHHQWLLRNSLSGTEAEAILGVLENGGHLLLPLPGRNATEPDKGLLDLLEKAASSVGYRTKWKHVLPLVCPQ